VTISESKRHIAHSHGLGNLRTDIALLGALLLAGCMDTFTDEYSTSQAARDDQIFERGWLPDVLPPSSHSIRVSGDVDVNTSEGEFFFAGDHFDAFASKLQRVVDTQSLPAPASKRSNRLLEDGYSVMSYESDQYIWIFLCSRNAARCEYHGWSQS
jgi:hypothetical protein